MTELFVDKLSVYAGEKCRLAEISCRLTEADHVVITGASGSGKTTLLRVLAGLESEFQGKACYRVKEEPGELSPMAFRDRTGLGVLFQENRLLPERNAVENVRVTLKKAGEGTEENIRRELELVLPGVDLTRPVGKLSGGEQRRVALVRAMVQESPVVLLDEPFSGLDEGAGELVRRYISRRSAGRIVLVTDHEGMHLPDWPQIRCGS